MESNETETLADSMSSTPISEANMIVTKVELMPQDGESDSQHIIETQYINMHRIAELSKSLIGDSLPAELLAHHVVDISSNPEFIQHVLANPQFYENSDFLAQHLSDDDRRLMVAVQLIQQNRAALTAENGSDELLEVKEPLAETSSMSDGIATVRYVQSNHGQLRENNQCYVDESHMMDKLYQPIVQTSNKLHQLPPLKKITNSTMISRNVKYVPPKAQKTEATVKSEDVQTSSTTAPNIVTSMVPEAHACVIQLMNPDRDADGYTTSEYERAPTRILPHKKRFPNKLKRAARGVRKRKSSDLFHNSTLTENKFRDDSLKNPYKCELCNRTSDNQLLFFEHLKSHYEPLLSSGDITISTVRTTERRDEPENMHKEVKIEENSVENVKVDEPSPKRMFGMLSNSHGSSFTCEICGRPFRRQTAYDCHMSLSHPKQEDIEEFSEPEDMMEGIRHVVNMVPAGDDEDNSQWMSTRKEEVKNTKTNADSDYSPPPSPYTVREDDEVIVDGKPKKKMKELACPNCDRTFVHRNSLLYHIRSHTGQRPYSCGECGKSFFAAGALKIHMRLHTGVKPYDCKYCGRFFRQRGDLKYHITSIHSNVKMYQCEFCGKNFARKYSLVVHCRIHTGQKDYICEYCTKTFRAASYLQNHRRIHTGEKPHSCDVCGKPFRVRSDMKRHMKTHGILSTKKEVETQEAKSEEIMPLDLNMRQSPEQYSDDAERNNTLYVWIQSPDAILPDN